MLKYSLNESSSVCPKVMGVREATAHRLGLGRQARLPLTASRHQLVRPAPQGAGTGRRENVRQPAHRMSRPAGVCNTRQSTPTARVLFPP